MENMMTAFWGILWSTVYTDSNTDMCGDDNHMYIHVHRVQKKVIYLFLPYISVFGQILRNY